MARAIVAMYMYLVCVSVIVCHARFYSSKGWAECFSCVFSCFRYSHGELDNKR